MSNEGERARALQQFWNAFDAAGGVRRWPPTHYQRATWQEWRDAWLGGDRSGARLAAIPSLENDANVAAEYMRREGAEASAPVAQSTEGLSTLWDVAQAGERGEWAEAAGVATMGPRERANPGGGIRALKRALWWGAIGAAALTVAAIGAKVRP